MTFKELIAKFLRALASRMHPINLPAEYEKMAVDLANFQTQLAAAQASASRIASDFTTLKNGQDQVDAQVQAQVDAATSSLAQVQQQLDAADPAPPPAPVDAGAV